MTLLKGLDVPELTAPELTGEWEFKLAQMERGRLKRDRFMHEIAGMTQKIVERAKSYESDTVPIEDPAQLSTPCPKCGKSGHRELPPLCLHQLRLLDPETPRQSLAGS